MCQFFAGREGIAGILVPYFRAAFARQEAALCMADEPLRADDARAVLAAACPDLSERERSGQMELVDYAALAGPDGKLDMQRMGDLYHERARRALERGFSGIRISSNSTFSLRQDADLLLDCESRFDEQIRGEPIVLLCSYDLDVCDSRAALGALRCHRSALSPSPGGWGRLENARLERDRDELLRLRRRLERERQIRRLLREADRRKDQFLTRLGHELRNPLSSILTTAQLMALRGADQTFGRELEIIERQVANITSMVDDLIDVTLIRAGRVKLDPNPVEAAEVVDRAVETLGPRLAQSSHRLEVDCPSRGLRIMGDAARLVQVVTNLLTNAVRHTPPGGDVRVVCERSADAVLISVADTGPGIDPAALSAIFEPFTRGRDSRHGSGLGIGLSIVRSLVELHGGSVDVESELGHGTRFIVTLPALDR